MLQRRLLTSNSVAISVNYYIDSAAAVNIKYYSKVAHVPSWNISTVIDYYNYSNSTTGNSTNGGGNSTDPNSNPFSSSVSQKFD